jgi:hypothetical protein
MFRDGSPNLSPILFPCVAFTSYSLLLGIFWDFLTTVFCRFFVSLFELIVIVCFGDLSSSPLVSRLISMPVVCSASRARSFGSFGSFGSLGSGASQHSIATFAF